MRSLPSICDGLKPSQRKVVFASFLRKLDKDEVKVSQLAGYTSDKSAYHHGEVSLQGTIINMAQNFIGSNNINILMPNGQFGTRRMGGKDSASARYLHTMFNKISQKIFRKEDEHIYQHIIDDGHVVEPINYSPIVPMVLVNGSEGIGTGFSTNIPCFNPISIVNSIYKRMDGKEFKELVPWYRGFKGTIKKLNEKSYESCGVFKIVSGNKIHIKEIPVGMWTQNYRDHLEYLLIDDPKKPKKHEIIIDYKDNSGNNNVDIMVELTNGSLQKLIKNKLIEKTFKLKKKINLSNMHMYDSKSRIKKYNNVSDILEEYYVHRLDTYRVRKEYYVKLLTNQMLILKYKVEFIEKYIKKKIVIERNKKSRSS